MILEALISFMPSPGNGAVAALDYTDEERKKLAKESVTFTCLNCGPICELVPELENSMEESENGYADAIAQLHMHGMDNETEEGKEAGSEEVVDGAETDVSEPPTIVDGKPAAVKESEATAVVSNEPAVRTPSVDDNVSAASNTTPVAPAEAASNTSFPVAPLPDTMDSVLYYTAVAIVVLLLAMLYHKCLQWSGLLRDGAFHP